ncbi:MAG: hypothetical protein L6Q76_05795 [Polyangiaceae bacterium]|nr:hypothetical protein [Polyangiaceae bacterium]
MSEERKREEEAEGTARDAAAAGSAEEPRKGEARGASGEARVDEPEGGDLDEVDLREMMRSLMDRPPEGAPPNILGGVQRKLRTRSRGKFYGDGWSTARTPRSTYLITSLFMLALIAFVFLVLIPWGSGALP